MSNLDHELPRGRQPERHRRYSDDYVNDEGHYHHHHYTRPLVALNPPSSTTALRHRQSNERARSQVAHRQGLEPYRPRYSRSTSPAQVTSNLGIPVPRTRNKSEQAAEKAISAAATAAFRIRNDRGHWVGEKGFKVASAAVAAATIDTLLDVNPHEHPLRHIAVAMVQGAVMDKIADGGRH
ncbi:uncharacterized protein PAC_18737 [Phialocephala subalpina]|uniref:Uncharacterized protein n=1 Tax=Phialocephala subalpina TaxID=576137 RepID=A0A1L7XV05_9HELO|nr:uncharacterized protein PAC_18737 [Phialocephala subalpina]